MLGTLWETVEGDELAAEGRSREGAPERYTPWLLLFHIDIIIIISFVSDMVHHLAETTPVVLQASAGSNRVPEHKSSKSTGLSLRSMPSKLGRTA
jgi:hypothetical protein